jgi:hypothetical protein
MPVQHLPLIPLAGCRSELRLQERASVAGARFAHLYEEYRERADAGLVVPFKKAPHRPPVGTHVAAPPYESATVKYLGFEYDISRGALRHFNEASYSLVSQPLGQSGTTCSDCKTITGVVQRVSLARENGNPREYPQCLARTAVRRPGKYRLPGCIPLWKWLAPRAPKRPPD